VDPQLLRGGFRIGFFIAAVALVTLPFQPRGSAEFVVTVLAAIIGGALALGVAFLARSANPPLPGDRGDKSGRNDYNNASQGGTKRDG
jgi:hypothetical protein